MKLNRVIILSFLFINIFCMSLTDVIEIAVGEWSPFTSEKNIDGRLAQVLTKEALSLVGLEVKYSYYPWNRAYKQAKDGEEHATLPWMETEDRKKDFHFSREVLIEDIDVIFHLKTFDFQWETFGDLKKYTIGATKGFYQIDFFKKHGIETSVVSDEILNFKKILFGRLNAYATSYYVGYDLIKREFEEAEARQFTHSKKPLRRLPFRIMISKNIPNAEELVNQIDEGLRLLKKSGRYDEIVEGFLK